MSRLDRFEEWLDDHTLVVAAVLIATLLILLALLIVACAVDSGHDDRPEWANDMAGQLDEKGGRIIYYANAIRDYSGASPTYRVDVSIAEDVYADKGGIIIKNGTGSIVQIPYDRVYAIYIGGSA